MVRPSFASLIPARLLCLLVVLTQGLAPFLHAHAGVLRTPIGAPLHLHLSLPATSNDVPAFISDEGCVVTAAPEYRRDNALLPVDLPLAAADGSPVELIAPGGAPILASTAPGYRSVSRHRPPARAPPAV